MRIKLDLSYDVLEADRKPGQGASEHDNTLTNFLVTQAISAKFPPPPGAPNRIIGNQVFPPLGEVKDKGDKMAVGRIQNTLVRAMNADAAWIDLSLDLVEWLQRVLEEWNPPPNWLGWVETLNDYMSTVLLEAKQAVKAASASKKDA